MWGNSSSTRRQHVPGSELRHRAPCQPPGPRRRRRREEEGSGPQDSLEGLSPPQRQGFGQQRAREALKAQRVDRDVSQLLGRHLHLPGVWASGWDGDRDGDGAGRGQGDSSTSRSRSLTFRLQELQTDLGTQREASEQGHGRHPLATVGTLLPPSQPRGTVRRSPLAEEARCRPREEGELGPAAAADLQTKRGESRGPGGRPSAPPAPAPTFPFRRLLYSSLLCRNFSISALTSTLRTLIISSTVRARLSTGWLNSCWRREMKHGPEHPCATGRASQHGHTASWHGQNIPNTGSTSWHRQGILAQAGYPSTGRASLTQAEHPGQRQSVSGTGRASRHGQRAHGMGKGHTAWHTSSPTSHGEGVVRLQGLPDHLMPSC